jgi:hypothetical protein
MTSTLFIVLAICLSFGQAAILNCPSAVTLTDLANCVRGQMPQSGCNCFVKTTAQQRTDYQSVVTQMLNGGCTGISMPASLNGIMQIRTFTDDKLYCLFMEVGDANNNGVTDKGWDTFIVNMAGPTREIIHQSPHTAYDIGTEVQAVEVFKATNSRAFMMAGSHRNALTSAGTCQGDDGGYTDSDAAHAVENTFQPALYAIDAWYGATAYHVIQWHGMAASTCGDNVFCSHGYDALPGISDKCSDIKNSMKFYHPTWVIGTPGQSSCSLVASTNVQARFLNGVAPGSVCGTAASGYSGQFISLEQDPTMRSSQDWIASIIDIWNSGPPTAPSNLVATGKTRAIALSWTGGVRVTGYNIKRATSANGPFQTVQTNVQSTSYTDPNLPRGITFYYKVSASNTEGESGDSNMASAKVK